MNTVTDVNKGGIAVALSGRGFLALWNGVDPARAGEYDFWHTREHVPERVGVPGMIGARRYADGQGAMPEYLTLYELESTAVLTSPPYRRLLETPTAWSRSMRPSFRGFERFGCVTRASLGGGLGGAAAAAAFGLAAGADAGAIGGVLARLLRIPAISAAHFGTVDAGIPAVPFQIGGGAVVRPADAVLLLEGFDRGALSLCLAAVDAELRAAGLIDAPPPWTCYVLGYAVARSELAELVTMSIRDADRAC